MKRKLPVDKPSFFGMVRPRRPVEASAQGDTVTVISLRIVLFSFGGKSLQNYNVTCPVMNRIYGINTNPRHLLHKSKMGHGVGCFCDSKEGGV
jgi:hypothetical protein